ncbi:MAG TPA: pyridoxal-phosphate dependent enzyme [Anaerolineales bacterium]
MIPSEWLDQARARIEPHIRRTPLTFDARRQTYIKWENRQVTGSFKARGAFNKVLSLEPWEREAGLVAVSAGNHGQGVALAAQTSGARVEVFVPAQAVEKKVAAMRALGAEVHFVEGGYADAEIAGREYAARKEKTWISPYNDAQVIAGQGTIALEILEDLPEPAENWIVPVGGGGLISGIGAALVSARPRPRLVGVQSQASPFAHAVFHRRPQEGLPDLPTLADGLSGALERDSVTIPLLQEFADDVLLVSEEQIAQAIAFAWYEYRETIEGSSAVTLAAILSGQVSGAPAVALITGGNIQPEVHASILSRFSEKSWA